MYLGRTVNTYRMNGQNNLIRLAKEGKLGGTYGAKQTNILPDALKPTPGIKNARVLVIGSTVIQ